MKMEYRTEGTCSRRIFLELEGISSLVEGMNRDEAIARLKGIHCGFKSTSCPDQLARALEESKRKQ